MIDCVKAVWISLITTVLLFAAPSAFARSKAELIELIREKVVEERIYKFGTEETFTLKEEQALLLKCTKNPDQIKETLICLTSELSKSRVIFILFVTDKPGAHTGGGSPLPKTIGAYREIEKAVAIAKWTIQDQGISLKFMITDDRRIANRGLRELMKEGDFSSSGNWGRLLDPELLKLTADERIEVFVQLWSKIKYNFANFDLVPNLDWDQVLEDYLPLVRSDQTNKEFHRLLRKCVASLKDGHTEVMMKHFSVFEWAQPPLRIEAIQGKTVITEIGGTHEIAEAGLKPGDEIVQIDGRPVSEILQGDIYPYVFASTPQWRDVKAYPYLLRGPSDSKATLCIRDLQGRDRDVTLTRLGNWGDKMPSQQFRDFELQGLGEGITYIAINTFGSRQVVDKFNQEMEKIRASKGLIIDVRKNGGGSSSNGDAIISRLIKNPIPSTLWKSPQHIAAFKAWGRPKPWYVGEAEMIKPHEGRSYLGPVVILVGPETFSAGEDFVVPLHAAGRAVVVGERTGGSTGQPLNFKFSYGIMGRICTKRDSYPDGRQFVGVGIIPDVEVHPTRADVASGRDAVLEKGIEVLGKKANLYH